jgi:hypothetical protein
MYDKIETGNVWKRTCGVCSYSRAVLRGLIFYMRVNVFFFFFSRSKEQQVQLAERSLKTDLIGPGLS